MRCSPTERQAALAARQLHYHRERLRWIRGRVEENEALLLSYLTRLKAGAAVLPGGYRISGAQASSDRNVAVEKLTPKSPYKQLELCIRASEVAREAPSATPPAEEEARNVPAGAGLGDAVRHEQGSMSHVERECGRCLGGVVHVGGPMEAKTAPCPDCRGTGKVLCFLYPKPKGSHGPWPPKGAVAEGPGARDTPRRDTKNETTEV